MAFVLQMSDVEMTLDFLTGERYMLEDGGVVIGNPEKVQTWTEVSAFGGARLLSNRNGNRKATLQFDIRSSSRGGLIQNIKDIELMLSSAVTYQLGTGSKRVDLAYSWDNIYATGYFEVLEGNLNLPDNVMSVEQMHAKINGLYVLAGCVLELTLSPDCFGTPPSTGTMIEVPLANENTSGIPTTGGVYIADYQDGRTISGKELVNYVSIEGTAILGDNPALAKIVIEENTGTDACNRFAIGHTFGGSQFLPTFLAYNNPSFTFDDNPHTNVALTDAASGYYKHITLDSTVEGDTKICEIAINDPSLFLGDYYRVIVHAPFNGTMENFFPDYHLYKVVIYTELNAAPLYTSEYIAVTSAYTTYLDFGPMPIPPFSKRLTNVDKLYIGFYKKGATQSPQTYWNIDYVLLLPCSKGYRSIVSRVPTANMGQYPTIVDDGWNDIAYAQSLAGKNAGLVTCQFAPIKLYPGVNQKLYFFPSGKNDNNFVQGTADFYKIKVYYSPTYQGLR